MIADINGHQAEKVKRSGRVTSLVLMILRNIRKMTSACLARMYGWIPDA